MSLLAQSPLWLAPFVLLILVMLHAMMEFTVSLLAQRPPPRGKPVAASELRRRLLSVNEAHLPNPLLDGEDCDLEIRWESRSAPPPGRWAIAKAASGGRLRLLLDQRRHEVRINQVTHSYFFFFGLVGWLPRLGGSAGAQSGPPGHPMAAELGRIAVRGGWSVRPVLWWFEATHRGYRLLETLTPAPLRRWPARRFWGLLYPLSYVLGIGYLVMIIGPLDGRGWLLLLGISVIWWGTWGFLSWMLCGFPALRKNS